MHFILGIESLPSLCSAVLRLVPTRITSWISLKPFVLKSVVKGFACESVKLAEYVWWVW